MRDTSGDVPKNGHVLTSKTIRTTYRLEKEKGQNKALKNVAFARKVSLFAATVAAVEGRHWGAPGRETGYCTGQLAYLFHNTKAWGELRILGEESARPEGGWLVKASGGVVTCAAWSRNRSILRT